MGIENQIEEIKLLMQNNLESATNSSEISKVYAEFLGKSGKISLLYRELGKASQEERPVLGKVLNSLKLWAEETFKDFENKIKQKEALARYEREAIDVTLPGKSANIGALNPVTLIKRQLVDIFSGMGFKIFEGPEIEDDYHNFTALNTPPHHPARDKQDTFYISEDLLLRTHTSPGQIRVMQEDKPPFKYLMPGRVFRCDDDATHTPMFHQMEGLVIDKNLTLCDLHGLLDKVAKSMFTEETKTRFRPSYFPFTEPSVEVDVTCCECGGKGCGLCKGTGWIEILGGGVVNRRVIANCGLDPDEYSGLAFGLGLDRIAMLKYDINNIHIIFDGDTKILKQFKR